MVAKIRDFAVITTNQKPDILKPTTAKNLNEIVTRLENTYLGSHGSKLYEIVQEFINHKYNRDNTHDVNETNLANFFEDIVDQLYIAYKSRQLGQPIYVSPIAPDNAIYEDLVAFLNSFASHAEIVLQPISRARFRSSLLLEIIEASESTFNDPAHQADVLTTTMFRNLINVHNAALTNSHTALDNFVYATQLPTPSLVINPFVMFDTYVQSANAGAIDNTNGALFAFYEPVSGVDQHIPTEGTIVVSCYLTNVQYTLSLIELKSTVSTDEMNLYLSGNTIDLMVAFNGIINYIPLNIDYTLDNHRVTCVVQYDGSMINLSVYNSNGTLTGQQITVIPGYNLNINTMIIGTPVTYVNTVDNRITEIAIYRDILSDEQCVLIAETL